MRVRNLRRLVVTITVAAVSFAGIPASGAHAATTRGEFISESFAGGSTPAGKWDAPSPKGSHTPCLTAARHPVPRGSLPACNVAVTNEPLDPPGQGVFRLTDNSQQDAGALLLDEELTTKQGLEFDFDMYMYNTSTGVAADGISFYLMDGQAPASLGEPGGSLGYWGLQGAVIGVGFDEFGNFTMPETGNKIPNNVSVRGAASANFVLVKTADLNDATQPLDDPFSQVRGPAKRHAKVAISPRNLMTVWVDFNDGKGLQAVIDNLDLDSIPGQPKLPKTLKIGFAASTGGSTAYHEIGGFTAKTLSPDLLAKLGGDMTAPAPVAPAPVAVAPVPVAVAPAPVVAPAAVAPDVAVAVTHDGTPTAGTSTWYHLIASDSAPAGPSTGPVTATFMAPAGGKIKSFKGDGWSCEQDGPVLTCTRSDALQPGSSFPPVDIEVRYTDASAGKDVTPSGTVGTPGDTTPANNSAADPSKIAAKQALPPDVSVALTHDGTPMAGASTWYHLIASNAASAGPSTGPVTATYTASADGTIKSFKGDGWSCEQDGLALICTRPDALQPGTSFPPVDIEVTYADDSGDKTVTPKAAVATPGDTTPGNKSDTDPSKVADKPVLPPDVSVALTHEGTPTAGASTWYHLHTSNAAPAGPSTDPVTATFTAPEGGTIESVKEIGWACKQAGQVLTCTRSDVLKPGSSFPPVDIEIVYADGSGGRDVAPSATVATPGDTTPANNGAADPSKIAAGPALPPDVSVAVTHDGQPAEGSPTTYHVVATNAAPAGPTTGPTTVTFTAPEGGTIQSATGGASWSCQTAGQVATCTGPAALTPGSSFPPVDVMVGYGPGMAGKPVTATGMVATPGDTTPGNNSDKDGVTVGKPPAKPPLLTVDVNHEGAPVAGGNTVYHLWVANDPAAEPTDQPVTATFNAPVGGSIKSATGDGWGCQTAGQVVTCTRPDALKPGTTYPQVNITVVYPPSTAGSEVTVTGTARTPDDQNQNPPPGTDTVALAKPSGSGTSNMALTIDPQPRPYIPGQKLKFTVTVTNTGPDEAKGANLKLALPKQWTKVPWGCAATGGSSCPVPEIVNGEAVPLKGSLDTVIDIAPGGKVVFVLACKPSTVFAGDLTLSGVITAPAGAVDVGSSGRTVEVTVSRNTQTKLF